MTTLAEIEAAVDRLSEPERAALRHRLVADVPPPPPAAETRAEWLERLARHRAATSRPLPRLTVEQILDDSRGE